MATTRKELEDLRERLLDLTLRNRLIKYRESRRRTLKFKSDDLFKIAQDLVIEEQVGRFFPASSDPSKEQPCVRLDTDYDEDELQLRLTAAYRDSNEIYNEQGYTVLFAAIGFLNWTDPQDESTVCKAPLILIPVSLSRSQNKFSLEWTGDELLGNISLCAFLHREFRLEISPFEWADDSEDIQNVDEAIQSYFAQVNAGIQSNPKWSISLDTCVDFFSFSKFVMHKDLDPAVWPENKKPWDHPLLRLVLDPATEEDSIQDDNEHADTPEINLI